MLTSFTEFRAILERMTDAEALRAGFCGLGNVWWFEKEKLAQLLTRKVNLYEHRGLLAEQLVLLSCNNRAMYYEMVTVGT